MIKQKKGFTLIEVLVAIVIFAIGILSMAALGALNYSYLRINQDRAKLHVLAESTIEDLQQWFRIPMAVVAGKTRFDSVFTNSVLNDTILVNIVGTKTTLVRFDHIVGANPADVDAKIYLGVKVTGQSGTRSIQDSLYFCVSNYRIGG